MMLLYILYNADLLDLPLNTSKEDTVRYVDDTTLLAIVNNFKETTCILKEC